MSPLPSAKSAPPSASRRRRCGTDVALADYTPPQTVRKPKRLALRFRGIGSKALYVTHVLRVFTVGPSFLEGSSLRQKLAKPSGFLLTAAF